MSTPRHKAALKLAKEGIYSNLNSFSELVSRIKELKTTTQQGDAFEVFVEAFLYTEPSYSAKQVWPVG